MVIIDLELWDASHAGSSWALSHWLHREGALEPGLRQILRAGAQWNVPRDTCAEAQSVPVITLSLLMPLHLPEDPGLRGKQNTRPRNNQRASSGKATGSQGQSSYPTKKFLSFLLPSISVRQHWVGGHGMSQAWWGVAVSTKKTAGWVNKEPSCHLCPCLFISPGMNLCDSLWHTDTLKILHLLYRTLTTIWGCSEPAWSTPPHVHTLLAASHHKPWDFSWLFLLGKHALEGWSLGIVGRLEHQKLKWNQQTQVVSTLSSTHSSVWCFFPQEAVSHCPEESQLARIQNVIQELPPSHYR